MEIIALKKKEKKRKKEQTPKQSKNNNHVCLTDRQTGKERNKQGNPTSKPPETNKVSL